MAKLIIEAPNDPDRNPDFIGQKWFNTVSKQSWTAFKDTGTVADRWSDDVNSQQTSPAQGEGLTYNASGGYFVNGTVGGGGGGGGLKTTRAISVQYSNSNYGGVTWNNGLSYYTGGRMSDSEMPLTGPQNINFSGQNHHLISDDMIIMATRWQN